MGHYMNYSSLLNFKIQWWRSHQTWDCHPAEVIIAGVVLSVTGPIVGGEGVGMVVGMPILLLPLCVPSLWLIMKLSCRTMFTSKASRTCHVVIRNCWRLNRFQGFVRNISSQRSPAWHGRVQWFLSSRICSWQYASSCKLVISMLDTMAQVIQNSMVSGFPNITYRMLHICMSYCFVSFWCILICGQNTNLSLSHFLFTNVQSCGKLRYLELRALDWSIVN